MNDLIFKWRRRKRIISKAAQYAFMRNIIPIGDTERRLSQEAQKIFSNSMPKAGSNLLSSLLRALPCTVSKWTYHVDETLPGVEMQLRRGRRGQIVTAHLPWSKEYASLVRTQGYRSLMMIRDPRDIALSNVHYVTRMDPAHPLHPTLVSLPNDAARLQMIIDPTEEVLAQLPDVWRNDGQETFLPWLDEPNHLLVRFEDLIGSHGGGDDVRQHSTITNIVSHVGCSLDDMKITGLADTLFGGRKKTFHKGQIGAWKEAFSDTHKDSFKRRSGSVLLKLGYETDMEW